MPLFDIPNRATKEDNQQLAKKVGQTKKPVKRVNGISNKIESIKELCNSKLGMYADKYKIINTKEDLSAYIDLCIQNGEVAIDTETTGLDPILDKIAGICIYTQNEKAAYIPINHTNYITHERTENQLKEMDCKPFIQRLADTNTKVIMFNAAFDIRVIRNQIGVDLTCYFDAYLAARCLNENEPSNKLKHLHNKYCLDGKGDAWTFDDLFNGVIFTDVPIKSAYLYAARDAEITYELYRYQLQFLDTSSEKCKDSLQGVANVFWNIEMPCVSVIAQMEDTGVQFNTKTQKELSEKYHKLLEEKRQQCYLLLEEYKNQIAEYLHKNTNNKLSDPINLNSPTQLAVLLYDILKIEPLDRKTPRGTGEAVLSKIDLPFCKALLEYRTIDKLIGTYIDKLLNCVNPKDGRIHCKFNQYGADTGRMSSSEPNLQNIPSHNKDIRQMFCASDGYYLLSSDYSQQEPKCLAALCAKSGDRQLLDTFLAGKDLYSSIASVSFGYPYEECREFNADGITNKAGKERRTQAKSILLGILYGRGIESVAEQLKCTKEKAQSIKDQVFQGFPAIKEFEESSLQMSMECGYVTTVCGRKRRLFDLQLPEYEFKWVDGICRSDDILDFSGDIPDYLIDKYFYRLKKAWGAEKRKIFEEANKEGIWIIDNGAKIADATRQCVNARIQGSAADLTKLAMIELADNKRLQELGFRLLIPVHDEIIAECPKENVKECSELLASVMSKAAEEILKMPIKCDVAITDCWYGSEIKI